MKKLVSNSCKNAESEAKEGAKEVYSKETHHAGHCEFVRNAETNQ
jgi:hypothetical protein